MLSSACGKVSSKCQEESPFRPAARVPHGLEKSREAPCKPQLHAPPNSHPGRACVLLRP